MDIKSVDNNEVTVSMWQRELERHQYELEKLEENHKFLQSILNIMRGLYYQVESDQAKYYFNLDDIGYTIRHLDKDIAGNKKDIDRVQTYIKHYQHELETSKGDIE